MTSVTIRKNDRDAALREGPEYCLVSPDLLEGMGVEVEEQIRVGPTVDAEYESALYTILGETSSRGTIATSKSGLDRLGLKRDAPGFARSYAPHPGYGTRAEAETEDEYAEILVDDGEQSDLVACAVHGGWIEYRTDRQSACVADALDATEWSCVGYNSGGGAYDRWHITSTDVDRRSFPRLDSIAGRQFTHAVSFHGFSGEGIAVGGGAPDSLRTDVRDAIDAATDGRYDVYLATDGEYDGRSSANFVNWLAADDNGIQIEQGWGARTDDWETIAAAVSRVYAERL